MPPIAPRTRTVAYVRVSTDKQADEGISLDLQREKVSGFAVTYDLDLIEVVTDSGCSAKDLDRPGMQRVLELLRSGQAEALLVFKLDRLTRSVRDLSNLLGEFFESGKCALLSVSDQLDTRSPVGELMLNILVSVGQWERKEIGRRTRDAMRHRKAQGLFNGGNAPYGFQSVSGSLTPHPAEQATIALARELRASGLSFNEVAAQLESRGHLSRKGTPFIQTQVIRMVR